MFFGATAITSFLIIIAIFSLLFWVLPSKVSFLSYIVLVALLTVLAFRFEPHDTDDIYRYFTQLDYLRDYGKDYFDRCMQDNVNGSNWGTYWVCGYYFWFMHFLPNNHWMPAITILICYGLVSLVICFAIRHFNISKIYSYLGTMFFLSTYWYYDVASGIRNGLAFTVICCCAYFQFVEKKYYVFCFAGYFFMLFLHSASIMPVLLVAITTITLNTSGRFINFLLLFGLIAGNALIGYVAQFNDNSFIQSLAGKAEMHNGDETFELGTAINVNRSVLFVLIILLLYFSKYLIRYDYAVDLKRLYKYSSTTVYFMVGSLFSALVFARFARWILPIIGMLIISIGSQCQADCIKKESSEKLINYSDLGDRLLLSTKPFLFFGITVFIAIHLWYLCSGSSLYWIQFLYET